MTFHKDTPPIITTFKSYWKKRNNYKKQVKILKPLKLQWTLSTSSWRADLTRSTKPRTSSSGKRTREPERGSESLRGRRTSGARQSLKNFTKRMKWEWNRAKSFQFMRKGLKSSYKSSLTWENRRKILDRHSRLCTLRNKRFREK